MKFTVTHSRGVVGENVAVVVEASADESMATVQVELDGELLDEQELPKGAEQYAHDFSGVGDAGPGEAHLLIVTVTDADDREHASTTQWTDNA